MDNPSLKNIRTGNVNVRNREEIKVTFQEFNTLENIFCAFWAGNIFVKVLVQDL